MALELRESVKQKLIIASQELDKEIGALAQERTEGAEHWKQFGKFGGRVTKQNIERYMDIRARFSRPIELIIERELAYQECSGMLKQIVGGIDHPGPACFQAIQKTVRLAATRRQKIDSTLDGQDATIFQQVMLALRALMANGIIEMDLSQAFFNELREQQGSPAGGADWRGKEEERSYYLAWQNANPALDALSTTQLFLLTSYRMWRDADDVYEQLAALQAGLPTDFTPENVSRRTKVDEAVIMLGDRAWDIYNGALILRGIAMHTIESPGPGYWDLLKKASTRFKEAPMAEIPGSPYPTITTDQLLSRSMDQLLAERVVVFGSPFVGGHGGIQR